MKLFTKKMVAAAVIAASFTCMLENSMAEEAGGQWLEEYREPSLSGFTKTWIYEGEAWNDDVVRGRIFADDLEDGDLTKEITSSGEVDTSKPGSYPVVYSVTDADGNTSTLQTVVQVLAQGNADEKLVQRKLYTLGDASHLTDIGFNRGYYHDRQNLGIWLPEGAKLQIRLVNHEEFDSNLDIGFYNADAETESGASIPASGEWAVLSETHGAVSVPFIKTPKNKSVQPVVEFKWTDEMREIPYYRYGDNEASFFERWSASEAPFAILECSAATFLVPIKDKDHIINSSYTGTPEYRFQSIDEMLEWYMAFVKQYDAFAGLDFYAKQPYNQNIRSKFFIKANKNGVGAAYYSSDHSASNSDSLGDYLTRSWLALHEFGHGYEGQIACQENSFVETTNNIMGHYFEKTYRPDTEFGWLLGDSNESTAEKRLETLEQKALKRKAETKSFNGIVEGGWHYQVSLHMFTNALDRLGPEETVSNMHESYRRYYYETGKMRNSSDAVIESFSESGYNMIPYFETYHISPSLMLENEIYEKDEPILYYLYDLVPDDILALQIRKKLGLPGVYCLVETDDLAYTGYTSQVQFQIQIDDLEQIKNKDIVIKNGKKIVKKIPVTAASIKTELPVGVYEVELPAPDSGTYSYQNICLIAAKGSAAQEIVYQNVTGNALADAMKLTMHGMSDCYFADVTIDTTEQKLTWHTLPILPHGSFGNAQYAAVEIYGPSGEELYSQTILGNEQLIEYEREVDFLIGSRIVITHAEGNGRIRVINSHFGDRAADYTPVSGSNAFVMTKYGLMQEEWDEEKRENVYLSCLKQYSQIASERLNGALLKNPSKFHQEKMVIQNAYQSLSQESRTEYDKKWGFFTGKESTYSYAKIPSKAMTGSADSQENGEEGGDGPASHALDGKTNTYWHSNWHGKNPVNFEKNENNNYTITLDQNRNIGKLEYVPRQGNSNGRILSCDLYYSETENGDDFQPVPHSAVVWENNRDTKVLEFDAENARRIRIHVTSAAEGEFISAAEFYLYEKKEIRLDDVDICLSSQIPFLADGKPQILENGVRLPAGSSLTYDVEGKGFDIFTALVSAAEGTADGKAAKLQIYGDDVLLYESESLESKKAAEMPYISITGVKKLKFTASGDADVSVTLADAKFYLTGDKESLTLCVGETSRLTDNHSLDMTELAATTWSSQNESVASVDAMGNITGVGVGETVVSAQKEGEAQPVTYAVRVKEAHNWKPGETDEDPDGSGSKPSETPKPAALEKPSSLAIGSHQTTSLTLTWTPVSGADGYEIYRAKKSGGAFEKIGDANASSFTDKKLSSGTDYVYKIRAYRNKDQSSSAFSEEVWSATKPAKTTIKKVKKSGTKAVIQWKKNKQAIGYEIWMKQKGAFKKMKNAGAKKVSIKSGKLKKGKKYTFKIRAYRVDGSNNKIYGAFSKTKTIKM